MREDVQEGPSLHQHERWKSGERRLVAFYSVQCENYCCYAYLSGNLTKECQALVLFSTTRHSSLDSVSGRVHRSASCRGRAPIRYSFDLHDKAATYHRKGGSKPVARRARGSHWLCEGAANVLP